MVQCLYGSMAELVKTLLKRFLKAEKVTGKAGKELLDINVEKTNNHLSDKDLEIDTITHQDLGAVSSARKK